MVSYINRPDHDVFKRSRKNLFGAAKNVDPMDLVKGKMVRGEETEPAIRDGATLNTPGVDIFTKSSLTQSLDRVRDSANIQQLLPDIKLALEVIIGTILSPKDLMQTTLTYATDHQKFSEDGASLLKVVQDYFTTSYKLKDRLEPMLWDILANTGSYPQVILPETTIDHIINGDSNVTLESLQAGGVVDRNSNLHSLGMLGPADQKVGEQSVLDILGKVSIEGHFNAPTTINTTVIDPCLRLNISDNYDGLKLPILKNKVSQRLANQAVNNRRSFGKRHVSKEGVDEYSSKRNSDEEAAIRKLYPNRNFQGTPILRVKTRDQLSKETQGHPTVIKYSTVCAIPVYNPNDPSDHIGCFFALDNTGAGLRIAETDNLYRLLQTSSNATGVNDVSSYLLNQARSGVTGQPGGGATDPATALQTVTPIYQSMVERDLLERLSSGMFGSGWTLGQNDQIYQLMLMRAMAGKQTQLLFVPQSLVSYGAVDYDDYGLGKTLLDDSKTLAAMRSMNMVVNSIANAKNAITKRTLNVDLDKAEKEPLKAITMIRNEFIKGTQAEFPITNSINDQIKYLQEAGVQVNIGEHELMASTKVGVEYGDNNYKMIDPTYDEWLRDSHARALGISPEIIEGAGRADFATQAIIANVLTARRIGKLSEKFCANVLSDFVRKYVYNSQPLFDELLRLVATNKITIKHDDGTALDEKETVVRFIESLTVTLPPPDTTSIKEQKEAFTEMKDFYTEAVEMFLSTDFLTDVSMGEVSGEIESVKAFMVSHYMRSWMRQNGVLPAMFDMLAADKDGEPVTDFDQLFSEYMDQIGHSILPLIKRSIKRSSDNNKDINKTKEKYDDAGDIGGDSGGGYDSSEPTSEESDPTDFDGGADLTADADLDVDEPAEEESEPAEENDSESDDAEPKE